MIDGLVDGTAELFRVEAAEFRSLQTGRVRNYALVTLVGAGFIAGYLFFFVRPA